MSANNDDGKWITVKGNHVFIKDSLPIDDAIKSHYKNVKYKECHIPAKTKPGLVSAINTYCNIYSNNSKYKIGGIYTVYYENYIYSFKIIDYNEYKFIKKTKIKGT